MAGIGEKIVDILPSAILTGRRGRCAIMNPDKLNQQTVAIAFIGNAVRIRGNPLYCKDDKRPDMSLSGTPDGKAGVG